jgi:hypothetical protein
MTVLIAIVLYVIALLVVLLLLGGVRRGDQLHTRSLRSMRNATREAGGDAAPRALLVAVVQASEEAGTGPGRRKRPALRLCAHCGIVASPRQAGSWHQTPLSATP